MRKVYKTKNVKKACFELEYNICYIVMKNCYKINNYSGIIIIGKNKESEFIIDIHKMNDFP